LTLAKADKRIGITAVSHKVIDNLLVAIGKAATADPKAPKIRLVHKDDGKEPAPGVEYMKRAADALSAIRPGTVVGGTAWLWADKAAGGSLDYLFIDEAGQMSLAQALAAARSAKNIVLLGDPQQLEQPSKGAHPNGADVAALVHLVGKNRPTIADDQGLFLESTYRLHPAICAFTSELYYENRLKPVAGLQLQTLKGKTPCAGAGLFLIETLHEGNQAQSEEEVRAVSAIVEAILKPGVTWTDRHENTRPIEPKDILVVAPYNAQVGALTRELERHGVKRVGTVDKFQGQEAPIVIYSCTSSSPQDAPRGMPFLYDPHRFNVATSRAQGVVIVVASPALFEPDCRTPDQMLWANGLCRYRELANALPLSALS
jgi:superfamily I DNA and/or RNA helicase